MNKKKHLTRSNMVLDFEFKGIRIQELEMTPVQWKISLDVIVSAHKDKSIEEI